MRISDYFLIPPSAAAGELFSLTAIDALSELLTEKNGKVYIQCQVRKKPVLAKPEEIVRQFWLFACFITTPILRRVSKSSTP